MRRPFFVSPPAAAALFASAFLAACSPTFNWREVRPEASELVALMPCKPDVARRSVPLAGDPVELQMLGCDAGNATFAVATADLGDPLKAGPALAQWKAATLANLGATASTDTVFMPRGATGLPQSVRSVVTGRRADGRAVVAQAVWFARGTHLFHAAVYANRPDPDVVETFFSGLKLQ